MDLIEALKQSGIAKSGNEARRLLSQGGVRVDDAVVSANGSIENGLITVGKRRFVEVRDSHLVPAKTTENVFHKISPLPKGPRYPLTIRAHHFGNPKGEFKNPPPTCPDCKPPLIICPCPKCQI